MSRTRTTSYWHGRAALAQTSDALYENATEFASQLAAGATKALGAAKRLLHIGWTETLETQMEHEAQTIARLERLLAGSNRRPRRSMAFNILSAASLPDK